MSPRLRLARPHVTLVSPHTLRAMRPPIRNPKSAFRNSFPLATYLRLNATAIHERSGLEKKSGKNIATIDIDIQRS